MTARRGLFVFFLYSGNARVSAVSSSFFVNLVSTDVTVMCFFFLSRLLILKQW